MSLTRRPSPLGDAAGRSPVRKGGGARLADALVKLVQDCGGKLELESHVDHVEVEGGRAIGVRSNNAVMRARRAVICNVTPQQLCLRLLDSSVSPAWVAAKAKNFRYGRSDIQIHVALSEPPRWPDWHDRFARTAIVHVSGGLDSISRAVNEAERGLLRADPTVVLGQPVAVDPSCAPAGSWIYWIQLQELPRKPAMLQANWTQRAVSGRNRSAKSLPILSCENWNVRSRTWRHPCESVS